MLRVCNFLSNPSKHETPRVAVQECLFGGADAIRPGGKSAKTWRHRQVSTVFTEAYRRNLISASVQGTRTGLASCIRSMFTRSDRLRED